MKNVKMLCIIAGLVNLAVGIFQKNLVYFAVGLTFIASSFAFKDKEK